MTRPRRSGWRWIATGRPSGNWWRKQHGALDTLQWDRIAPYWLVAEIGGEIVGALQTCPSRPIGRLEMLSLDRDLTHGAKALTVKALAYGGYGVIWAMAPNRCKCLCRRI
jgi:hypothetical protein